MSYSDKILYLLYQLPPSQFALQSEVTALLYIIDQEDKNADTTHYTKDNSNVTVHLSSSKIQQELQNLQNKDLVEHKEKLTFGGETRDTYRVTPSGIKTIENSTIDVNKTHIDNIYEEYCDYPISNLLNYIQTEYYTA